MLKDNPVRKKEKQNAKICKNIISRFHPRTSNFFHPIVA
jgi:hypothetical protein